LLGRADGLRLIAERAPRAVDVPDLGALREQANLV
jgi:hypothetical protein